MVGPYPMCISTRTPVTGVPRLTSLPDDVGTTDPKRILTQELVLRSVDIWTREWLLGGWWSSLSPAPGIFTEGRFFNVGRKGV